MIPVMTIYIYLSKDSNGLVLIVSVSINTESIIYEISKNLNIF